jgi:hypothetical protein
MKTLRSFAIAAALLGATTFVAPASAQQSSYTPGSVFYASRLKVMPGQFENYMDYLSTTWKKIQEFGKKEGIVLSYRVLSLNNARHGEPDLILLIEHKDYSTTAQREAYDKKLQAFLAMDERKMEAGGAARGVMRESLGNLEYQELILK